MAKVKKRYNTRKDGTKTCSWAVDFINAFGEREKKSGFQTKADAETYLVKTLASPPAANEKNYKDLTIVEACKMYIDIHAEMYCKKTTVVGYKGYLTNHIKPFFKNSKLIDLTKIRLEQFLKSKKDEGLSAQTINHILKYLKAVFQKMFVDEIISSNPAAKVKPLPKNPKQFDVLDSQEVEILLNTAKKHFPDFYPLVLTAIFTGMREGELFALRWDKIDWNKGKILVDSNFTLGELTTPKSKKSRIVDMSSELAKMLREWKLRCPHSDKNLVFPNKAGNYLDPNNLNKRMFHPLIEKAKIKKVRFHDLRHTFASLLISKNLSPKYIQTQLGHSSITMTMDTYGHILPEVTIHGVNALDSILKQQQNNFEQNQKAVLG